MASSTMTSKLVGAAVAAATLGGAYMVLRNRKVNRNTNDDLPSTSRNDRYHSIGESSLTENGKEGKETTDAKHDLKQDAKNAVSKVKDHLKDATTTKDKSKTEGNNNEGTVEDNDKAKASRWPFGLKKADDDKKNISDSD